jgi:hypothetical protein
MHFDQGFLYRAFPSAAALNDGRFEGEEKTGQVRFLLEPGLFAAI